MSGKRGKAPEPPASSESDVESEDSNFVGVGGKWEFIGEPFKKSQRRRFYNALRVFNGDVVRIGDGVLLSAEENKPPYIARIHSMWEEPKSAGREAGHFIKAHWYYRPKDVPPKVLSAGLPKGKTVAKEVFYTDEVEDNDVRSVYGLAAIRSEPHPSGGSYLRQNEYVCRFQYFPSESRFGPVPAPKLPRAPEAESVGSGGKDKKGGSSRSPSPSASSSLANAAGSAPEQKKAGPSRKRSPSPSTASSADATLAEETSAAATSVARKSAASNAESSASSPSAPSSVRGRHLSITSPGAEEGDKEGSDSGEGDPGKRRERTRVTRHGESPLLSPRSAGGVRIECSRVGPNFQADVPASTLASLAGAMDAAAAGAPKEAPDAMPGGAQGGGGGGGEEEEEDKGGVHGDEQMGFMHRQPLARSGMAATMGLLTAAGDLNSHAHQEFAIGRAKDVRRFHHEEGEFAGIGDRVKIEHRDADGRLLTRKEAYRQMSYKFHGHGPKQSKQEKRKKELDELEASSCRIDQTKIGTAAALQKALSASGAAYMPISGGAASLAAGRKQQGMGYMDDLGYSDSKSGSGKPKTKAPK
eukprot:CAMPEP_0171801942 /NCGR_PEP_ID=MMETSP0991-20121206/72526_1 /TAXON_ID=483369 /ORGANISM="non described non described, Strain CCMP2098" /LENGTH=584 /DNA_ID=CAMNT_0012413641 /DNA_START=48 /DNA_END=1802 /DNA_ORIENTATION=-